MECPLPKLFNLYEVIADGKSSSIGFYTTDDMATLRCRHGYEVDGGDGYTIIRCDSLGMWRPDPQRLPPCIFVSVLVSQKFILVCERTKS